MDQQHGTYLPKWWQILVVVSGILVALGMSLFTALWIYEVNETRSWYINRVKPLLEEAARQPPPVAPPTQTPPAAEPTKKP